jgi:hypothetical protein
LQRCLHPRLLPVLSSTWQLVYSMLPNTVYRLLDKLNKFIFCASHAHIAIDEHQHCAVNVSDVLFLSLPMRTQQSYDELIIDKSA